MLFATVRRLFADARFGAAVHDVVELFYWLDECVLTRDMDQMTPGWDLETPRLRAEAVVQVMMDRVPGRSRDVVLGINSADSSRLTISYDFRSVPMALPSRIVKYIQDPDGRFASSEVVPGRAKP